MFCLVVAATEKVANSKNSDVISSGTNVAGLCYRSGFTDTITVVSEFVAAQGRRIELVDGNQCARTKTHVTTM